MVDEVKQLDEDKLRAKAREHHDKLNSTEIRQAIERDMLSERQLADLNLDTPEKVQAVLRDEEPSTLLKILGQPHSGNVMVLTDDEIAEIEERRSRKVAYDKKDQPTIKVPTADGSDDDGDDSDNEEVPPYEEWTNEDLRAEIAARNEDRDSDQHLSVSGTKAELVERLEDDDKAKG